MGRELEFLVVAPRPRLVRLQQALQLGLPALALALTADTREAAGLLVLALDRGLDVDAPGAAAGVVTGPVSKAQLYGIGFTHPGQTEFIAERCGVGRGNVAMMLAGPTLRAVPATVHVPGPAVGPDRGVVMPSVMLSSVMPGLAVTASPESSPPPVFAPRAQPVATSARMPMPATT